MSLKKKEILNEISSMHDKYESLVKYARVRPEHIIEHKRVEQLMIRMEKEYPKEVSNICSKDGDWHHGFNSGMLAACRYILNLNDVDKDFADNNFPFLDT